MIDMHIHAVRSNLPGTKTNRAFYDRPREAVAAALTTAMQDAGITSVLAMGCVGTGPDDPLGIRTTQAMAQLVPNLYCIGFADPSNVQAEHLMRAESEIAGGAVKALKGYLGYLHYGPDHPNYRPYFEMAAKYDIPMIFHTGDPYSKTAKVKYAHPILVDEVAVDHPGVRFVMAHLGNPWLMDAAEVVYKNANVYADLSGLLVGDAAQFAQIERRGTREKVAIGLANALDYAESWDRIVYGSDWPLAPMGIYREFIASVVPAEHHQAVFEDNARALFGL